MASAAHTDEPAHFPNTPGLRAGQVLAGRYSIARVIGSGGMATIVEATHLELGSRVAIKVLHTMHSSTEAVDRFLREARAIFPLRSENVCRVLDLGRLPDGAPFIVMEYLDGTDFASGFRNKQVPPSQAAAYVAQACRGLAEAHALGIIHRDIKPANLFLTRRSDGTDLVKVLDFGISKLHREGDETLTAEGQVLGTPRYMAPEQFGGARTADARADVWALGLVLYKLSAGRLPYSATTVADIYAELMNRAPEDLRQAVPGIDPALAAVVMRCLERDAAKRFASARELGAALERFAGGTTDAIAAGAVPPSADPAMGARAVPPSADPATLDERPARSRRARVAALAVGALAVVGAATFFASRSARTASPPFDAGVAVVVSSAPAVASEAATNVVVPPPPSAREAVVASAPAPRPKPPAAAPRNCNPPYYFDRDHIKHFRPECVH